MYRKCIREDVTKRELAYMQGENAFRTDGYDPRNICIDESSDTVLSYGQPAARVNGDMIFSVSRGCNIAAIEGDWVRMLENRIERYETEGGCSDLEKAALFICARNY